MASSVFTLQTQPVAVKYENEKSRTPTIDMSNEDFLAVIKSLPPRGTDETNSISQALKSVSCTDNIYATATRIPTIDNEEILNIKKLAIMSLIRGDKVPFSSTRVLIMERGLKDVPAATSRILMV